MPLWLFKCIHPFRSLYVRKEQTVTPHDEDFEHVHYHFRCAKCGEELTIGHSRLIGGLEAFVSRGRPKT